jgi:hypothetical protein
VSRGNVSYKPQAPEGRKPPAIPTPNLSPLRGLFPKTANPRLTPWANFYRTSSAKTRNSIIHALLTGKPLKNHGYEYFGERAYKRWMHRDQMLAVFGLLLQTIFLISQILAIDT